MVWLSVLILLLIFAYNKWQFIVFLGGVLSTQTKNNTFNIASVTLTSDSISNHLKRCMLLWMATCIKSLVLTLMVSCVVSVSLMTFRKARNMMKTVLHGTKLECLRANTATFFLVCLFLGIKGCGRRRRRCLQHPRTHCKSGLLSGWKGHTLPGATCQPCELALRIIVQKMAA